VNETLRSENRRLSRKLAVVALGMFGFGFAMVPFYNQICQALGIYTLEQKSELPANTQVDASRTVTVEFDSNTRDLPWRFQPTLRHITVHPGEVATVEYEVINVRGSAVTGQAVPSYGPSTAAEYFHKIECFCFRQQTLAAGETRRLPIVFVIDPKLPKDVATISLSYTFFEVAGRGGKS
jgi:cytochrome c oxidase assembly protein subunit 11